MAGIRKIDAAVSVSIPFCDKDLAPLSLPCAACSQYNCVDITAARQCTGCLVVDTQPHSAAAAGASGLTAGTGAGAVDVFVVKTSSVVAHLRNLRLNKTE